MFDTKLMGNRLLLSRRDLSLNQDDIALKSGVSRTYISQLERGVPDNVSVDIVFALADALGVSPGYLMGITSDPLAGIEEEEEITFRESRTAYNVDPATRELLELIEGMDGSQRQQLIGIARVLSGAPRVIGGGR